MKTCTRCNRTKTLARFPRSKTAVDGRHTYCILCNRARKIAVYKGRNAVEKEKAKQRKWKREGMPLPLYPAPDTCECCGKFPGKTALHLDHDHSTGTFRGWLCGACNRGIGYLGDTLTGALCAVEYLCGASK